MQKSIRQLAEQNQAQKPKLRNKNVFKL